MAMLHEGVIGLSEAEARLFLSEHGMTLRVIEEDGMSYICTADYDTSRINVAIANGIVVSCEGEG